MIALNEETKNAFKQNEREIKVYGNLYLAKRRNSNNLLDQSNYVNIYNLTYNNGVFTQAEAGDTSIPDIQIQSFLNGTYIATLDNQQIQLGVVKFSFIKTNEFNQITYKANDRTKDTTVRFDISNLINGKTYYIGATITNATQGSIAWKNMYISEEDVDYEEYGTIVNDYTTFPLTLDNECQILGFNINEKSDIYYTSLPYNTMTIDVNNEKGYFTDYDSDSIINKLNSDCYVDLFCNINNGDYFKLMTMNFDKIQSSDYEKAKLSFKSSISLLKNLPLRDKNKYFVYPYWNMTTLLNYFIVNYKINARSDVITNSVVNTASLTSTSAENLLLKAGTRYGELSNALIVTNNTNNDISLRKWENKGNETILQNYQLEKPIIKRENTYQGINYEYINSYEYASSNETYQRTINGILTRKKEILVYKDVNYRISDLTINDFSISSGITLNIEIINTTTILLIIEGNINQEYTISMLKENIYKRTNDDIREKNTGVINDTSKVLKIKKNSPLNDGYYNLILSEKKVKSNIEVKIMALPYLEVGDTVEIETDLAKITMTITEINMIFDGALIMTIKGYELGWDMLFPSDTLYPSDDLYPNMAR